MERRLAAIFAADDRAARVVTMVTWHYVKPVTWILLAAVLLASPTSTNAQQEPPPVPPPNIILIMLDDLGTEGLAAYGGETYRTPNIDKLAEEGVRFSRFYAHPKCVPTRASLLTGLYPPRTGWTSNDTVKVEEKCLDPTIGTFVQVLQDAGYSTAVAGKWHICPFKSTRNHPARLGFDEWILSFPIQSHWGVKTWVNGVRVRELETKDIYIADEHTKFAIKFIRRNAANPFFLYFPTKLPHKFWSKTPDNLKKNWPDDDPRYFPGMVKYADEMIGRIRQALKEEGIKNQTIIIFLTDNGTSGSLPGGGKGDSAENGINVPLIIRWPGTTKPGATRHNLADVTDLYPTILEMAGLLAPTNRDGYSLVPALTEEEGATGRRWIYAQNGDRFAISKVKWKLREDQELFNLKRDRFERNPIRPKNDTRVSARKRKRLENILRKEGLGILPLTVVMGDNVESLGWESWLLLLIGGIFLWFVFHHKLRGQS